VRHAANAILVSVGLFLALVAGSMAAYPGGSWLDLQAGSHDLLRNFLCDLLGPIAINGEPNGLGSRAMITAMVILALGLGVTWWSIPGLFTGSTLGKAIRGCGTLSLIGLVAVPLTPPTVSYQLHAAAVFTGGGPAAAAFVLSLVGLARDRRTHRLALLGGLAFLWVLIGFGLYARQYFFGGGPTVFLPASHRVATLCVLGWLIAIALQLRARHRVQGSSPITTKPLP